MDTQDFRPLCVIPAVPHGKGLRFLHPRTQYQINEYVDLIWAILVRCNGHDTSDTITAQVSQAFPEVPSGTAEAILGDLCRLGVLLDSREAYWHFHQVSTNPMPYAHEELSPEDIHEYTRRSRLPIVDGEAVYQLHGEHTSLQQLQMSRRSCRGFSERRVSIEQIGQLLITGYSLIRRSNPSAGGLYPLKLYLIVTRDQAGLAAGYYEYDPESHQLIKLRRAFDRELMEYAFNSETLLFDAPSIVVVAADMQRQPGKYSNRGYCFTLLEAGHAAQNLVLSAAEQGLATLEYGGFLGQPLAEELCMDTARVSPLITVAAGYAAQKQGFSIARLLEDLTSKLVGPGKLVAGISTVIGGEPSDTFFAAIAHYRGIPTRSTDTMDTEVETYRLAGGAATSKPLAHIKALAEAYERSMSGQIRVDKRARASELTEQWLHPQMVVPFSDEQFANSSILQPFDVDAAWEWVAGSTAAGERVWVPVDIVFYPLSFEKLGRKLCYNANSSGVAAHTSEREAVASGLLELVERDAIMRGWLQRTAPGQVPLELLPYHWKKRARYWQTQGRHVYVLAHSNYGAVVVQVLIVSEDRYPCFVSGAAASVASFDEAIGKAFRDVEFRLIQTLKRPPVERIAPEAVARPGDHTNFYAYPEHLDNLQWLWKGVAGTKVPVPSTSVEDLLDACKAVTVKLNTQDAPLYVVRILSERLVPISFGWHYEHYTHEAICERVNPQSLRLPHYFG